LRVLMLLMLLAAPAGAGRRPWIFAEDTAMVPDGDVEIESWIGFIDRWPDVPQETSVWHWWLGPVWSPYDGIEIAAYTVLAQPYPDNNAGASLWFEQLSLRWRVIERRFGALFLKLEGRIAFHDGMPFQVQPSVAWAKHVGRFGFAASFGYAAGFEGDEPDYHWLVYRAAASFDIIRGETAPPFQIGAEFYMQEPIVGFNDLTNSQRNSVLLGPTLAVARGRLWLTLGALAGLTDAGPRVMVRGILGLSL
jgi:hypothetical protein